MNPPPESCEALLKFASFLTKIVERDGVLEVFAHGEKAGTDASDWADSTTERTVILQCAKGLLAHIATQWREQIKDIST